MNKEEFKKLWKETFPTGSPNYADVIFENIKACGCKIVIDWKGMASPIQSPFGLIPEMPKELSASELAIIGTCKKYGYSGIIPKRLLMPHQIYVRELKEILGDKKIARVYILPASRAFPVKVDGKKIWIGLK